MRFLVGTVGSVQSVFAVVRDYAINLTSAVPGIGCDLSALAASPDLVAQAKAALGTGDTLSVSDIAPVLVTKK